MSFGLRNAAQTFQRFMDEVLRGLDFVYVYLDDILIASESESSHLEHLKIVFDRLEAYGIVTNPAKCIFGESEVPFLGYLVTADGISPRPEKAEEISTFKQPATAKALRQFLGMVNFYRICLPNAAETQAPLHEMLHGNIKGKTPLNWTPVAEAAFEKTKADLTQATLLAYPKCDATLALVCDASDHAVGAVIQQKVGDAWEPLGFFSKKLSKGQTTWSTFDRELVAIYLAIQHFQHMLEARVFTILTDHMPLTFAFKKKLEKSSPRQIRHLPIFNGPTTHLRKR